MLHDPAPAQALTDGVLVIGPWDLEAVGIDPAEGNPDGLVVHIGPSSTPVRLVVLRSPGLPPLLTPATAEEAFGPAVVDGAWVHVEPTGGSTEATVGALTRAVARATGPSAPVPAVNGELLTRIEEDRFIASVLRGSLGLLAMTVVIAVLGVVSTLTLSVLERRREHALLRAVGLTRGQLRASLASEGVLLAAVGVALGCIFGVAYGLAAAAVVSTFFGQFAVAVPWTTLAVASAGGVLAGLVAAILPVRSALRVAPVAALSA